MSILIHLGVIIVSQLSLVREYAIPRYLIKIVEHYMAVRILIFFFGGGGGDVKREGCYFCSMQSIIF